jgi:hypothetical protein
MRKLPTLIFFALIFAMQIDAQAPAALAEIWEKEHVSNILPSNVRHKDLKKYLDGLRSIGLKVAEVGRSVADREIYQVEWGRGPLKVFLWSQMHGDEPTATSALIDLLSVLQKNKGKGWVKRIEETVTLRAVPMLNPDGAELYVRRNLMGIDINRDARDLKTPEAQVLKSLRDSWSPDIGFNLHNQNYLTTAGEASKQAAISFLVVYGDAEKTASEGHERNKRLVAAMVQALNQFIPGNIARYSDEWTPTAFGDNFSAWGTPVILIETGGLHERDETYLVKMNFIAILTALKSLADGSEKSISPANYELIPNNGSGRLFFVIFRNASVLNREQPDATVTADIGINLERRRAEFSSPAYIRQVGDLSRYSGLDEYDASEFHAVGRFQPIRSGNFGEILFYKKDRQVDWASPELEKAFPPDAIFSLGNWIKGEGVVPKKQRQ